MAVVRYREVSAEETLTDAEEQVASFDPVLRASVLLQQRDAVQCFIRAGMAEEEGKIVLRSAVWNKLYAAGIRLMGIIERSSDCKSKELVVLTNRINALCDKQEKAIKKDNTR